MAFCALPYIRKELPAWGKAARIVGLTEDELWRKEHFRTIRGKLHGYAMRLDLRNWSDRQSYFLQRYYDLPGQLLLQAALRPGDRFIDVGANIGMMTLLGARCVSETGHVEAFEPNPVAFARLNEHIQINHLSNVTARQLALSDQPGELVLRVIGAHTGCGTLGAISEHDKAAISMEATVQVARGDDLLAPDDRPTLIKIDVEGFECNVLSGLQRMLRETRAMILTETIDAYLRRANSSIGKLYEIMGGLGFAPYDFFAQRERLHYRIRIQPMPSEPRGDAKNVVWLHPESVHAKRLASFIDRAGDRT